MTRKRLLQIMAYVYMPLFFALLGYGIVFLAALPVLNTVRTVGSIITSNGIPNFDTEFNIIYDKDTAESSSLNQGDTVDIHEITMPSYGTEYANVSCTRISLNAPLFFGDNSAILRNGMGQYIGSSIPGMGLPILLCGHNTTYCLPLKYIDAGDIITISTNYGTYEYRVSGKEVHDMNDTNAYDLTQSAEQLIVYTCYPFDMIGSTSNRLFVYADKISGPEINYAN